MKSVPAFLLIVAGAVGLIAVYFTYEPAGRALPGSEAIAASHQEAKERANEDDSQT